MRLTSIFSVLLLFAALQFAATESQSAHRGNGFGFGNGNGFGFGNGNGFGFGNGRGFGRGFGRGNGRDFGRGFGRGRGGGRGNGGGGGGGAQGAPAPLLATTLFGQAIAIGGGFIAWRRRKIRKLGRPHQIYPATRA